MSKILHGSKNSPVCPVCGLLLPVLLVALTAAPALGQPSGAVDAGCPTMLRGLTTQLRQAAPRLERLEGTPDQQQVGSRLLSGALTEPDAAAELGQLLACLERQGRQ